LQEEHEVTEALPTAVLNFPAGQSEHLAPPAYIPGGHGEHMPSPGSVLKCPGAHFEHTAAVVLSGAYALLRCYPNEIRNHNLK
jgi:hypothetical protein